MARAFRRPRIPVASTYANPPATAAEDTASTGIGSRVSCVSETRGS